MKFFTIREMCASDTARRLGIGNAPSAEATANLERLVDEILDPLREQYGYPINVTSGYRCPSLNCAVGGATSSDHLTGCAADICVKRLAYSTYEQRMEHARLWRMLMNLLAIREQPWHQVIWEKGDSRGPAWIHVSLRESGNRRQLLRTDNGKIYYQVSAEGLRR